jgi:hypothetical protein
MVPAALGFTSETTLQLQLSGGALGGHISSPPCLDYKRTPDSMRPFLRDYSLEGRPSISEIIGLESRPPLRASASMSL